MWWEKVACWSTKAAISLKRIKIEEKLLWMAYRKSPTHFRFFGSPPYFYFQFHLYIHRDGRFCLIFAHTAQQSVLDGTSSEPCAYYRIVQICQKCQGASRDIFAIAQLSCTLLVPAHPGSPMCVCVCVCVCVLFFSIDVQEAQPLSNLGTWPCNQCSRICSSRIGLYTHQLTHR